MPHFKLLYFFFSFLFFLPSYGLQPYFRHYTVENGLSSNTIQCLLQDQTEYIWCRTPDDLNRFDSRYFKTFRHIPGDISSLSNNIIHSLLEDSDGILWIGTENGVFRYHASLEKFPAFPLPYTVHRFAQNIVYNLQEDHRGNIWISIFGNNLFGYDPYTIVTRYYLSDINDTGSLISNLPTQLLVNRKGKLWITTHDKDICKYSPYSDTFTPINATDLKNDRTARCIYALCKDLFRNFRFGDNGLYKYNKTTHSCIAFFPTSSDPLQYVHYKWLLKLNKTTQENISNTDFSVNQLARNENMSRTLLYTKVKAVTGLPPNEFIRSSHLRNAAEYLVGNEYKIN